MKTNNMTFLTRLGAFCAPALLCCVPAAAGTIEIGFTGLDLTYNGSTITDTGAPADPLASVSVELDSVPVAGSPFGVGSTMDLSIPGVNNIAIGGDTLMSGLGGSLDLVIPGGYSLNLDLDQVNITYVNLGSVQFAFGGTVGAVDTQNLPGGLMIGSPVTVTLSASITSSTNNGTDLLTFRAKGSGSIEGQMVPEPTSVALLGCLAAAGVVARRR